MGYTLSFFINGYGIQPEDILDIEILPALPLLKEEGFIFEGWFFDEDLSVPAEEGLRLTTDTILYASWSKLRENTMINGTTTYALVDGTIQGPELNITPIDPSVGGGGGTSGSVADDIPLPSVDPNYDKWPVVPNKTVGTKALYQYVSEVQDYIKLTELGDTVGATFKEYSNFKFPGTSSYGTPTISTLYVPTTTDSWRLTTIPDWKYWDETSKTVKNVTMLTRGAIAKHVHRVTAHGGTSDTKHYRLTRLIKSNGVRGFCLTDRDAPSNIWEVSLTDSTGTTPIVPPFIIFELQAAGGGGGSSSLSNSRNGSGGGGGGFLTGVLKLDFNKYDAYDFSIGYNGKGGKEFSPNLFYSGDGMDAANSGIYGVNIGDDGEESRTILASVGGGAGGYCANDTDWSQKHTHTYRQASNNVETSVTHSAHTRAAGGTVTVYSASDIFCYKAVSGGAGGQTNATGTCSGDGVSSVTHYYTSDTNLKTWSNLSTTYSSQSGGAAGSSSHSGGGGAAMLGTGGKGGGTASSGNTGSGYGGGGGGGRWTIATILGGADGSTGILYLYY